MTGLGALGDRRMNRRQVLAAALAVASHGALAQPGGGEASARSLAGQHPAEYYKRSADLLAGGQKDDAVFVFYLGQLRYRTHLAARPDLPKSGDPALFASLSEVVGRPINEYAFGDMPSLLKTVDAVLAYDARNPDAFTPPAQFADAHRRTREGMAGFRRQMQAQAEDIKRQRTTNGLPNRW
jgi:hypothetical protein